MKPVILAFVLAIVSIAASAQTIEYGTTLVATALHDKHSIKTKNQCSCYEKRMNEQRNISLQVKSLAFRQHRRQSLRRTGDFVH